MAFWMDFSQYAPNTFALQTLTVAIGIFLLGALVLFRERWSTEGILFWICTVTIGIWLFSFTWMYSSKSVTMALFWAKSAYLGVPFIPSAIYHFSTVVLRISQRYRRRIILNWLISAFFAFTIITSDLLVSGLYHYSWGYFPKYGWLSAPYLAFFFGVMVLTLRHYWMESRAAKKGTLAYSRAKELLIAFGIAYLASVDFLPKYGVPVYPLGYIFVFCFLLLASNVIWQYRLVDLTPAFAADLIIETMNEPLIVCDLEEKVRIVNPAFARLFGYDRHEVQGRPVREFGNDGVWYPVMVRDGSVKNHECVFRTRRGASVYVSLSATTLRSSNGKPQGCVIVVRDITERKRLEQELKSFNETLEEGVRKRTKELANKIQELEWLNMVMMGREERILELKDQLREKEKADGNPAAADAHN